MRLLYIVQRYSVEVAAAAAMLCREYAARLPARGHEVDVLTSKVEGRYERFLDQRCAPRTEAGARLGSGACL